MLLEQRLASEVQADPTAWVDAVLARVGTEVPDLVRDDAAADLAAASSRALLTDFAAALSGEPFRAPVAALGFARHLARTSVPLAALLRSYRLGQELLFLRAADLAGPEDTEGLRRVGLLTFRFVDAVVGEVTDVFEREREDWLRGSLARQERVVDRLLAGEDVPEAERVLGRRLTGRHRALIAWSEPATRDPAAIADALRPALEAAGTGAPLVMHGPAGEVFAWYVPDDAGTDLPALPYGIRMALGETGEGPAGFATSRHQADAARRTARHLGRPVVAYAEVRLLHLLLRDHGAAVAFAREELGALAEERHAALRHTLQAFLEHGRDASATAQYLGLHRNTVMRRLARAEELRGAGSSRRPAEALAALLVLSADRS